jgi:hypothetical protein
LKLGKPLWASALALVILSGSLTVSSFIEPTQSAIQVTAKSNFSEIEAYSSWFTPITVGGRTSSSLTFSIPTDPALYSEFDRAMGNKVDYTVEVFSSSTMSAANKIAEFKLTDAEPSYVLSGLTRNKLYYFRANSANILAVNPGNLNINVVSSTGSTTA